MTFDRKQNKLNKVAIREWLRPPDSAAMTGSQIAKMVVAIIAIIAFALMTAWFVGKIG